MRLGVLLDDISSTRSSTTRQSQVLDEIEEALAMACTPSDKGNKLTTFISLQDAFETNVASRMVAVIASWLPLLQYSAGEQCECNVLGPNVDATVLNILRILSILQGVSLLHKPSQQFLGREWCLELFLDLLVLSRQLSQSAHSSPSQETLSSLASAVLDTLLCILVDTPDSIRHFEQAGGLEIIVRTLKRASVPRDVRMKCLEFLYFYLLPEDGIIPGDSATPLYPAEAQEYSLPQALSIASSQFKKDATMDGWDESSNHSDSSDETYAPNPKVAELQLLKQELSFIPITPKKPPHALQLKTGTPIEMKPHQSPVRPPHKRRTDRGKSGMPIGHTIDEPVQPRPQYQRHVREESVTTLVGSQLDPSRSMGSRDSLLRPSPTTRQYPAVATKAFYPGGTSPSKGHDRIDSITGDTLVGRKLGNIREAEKPKIFRNEGITTPPGRFERTKTGKATLRSTKEKTLLLENYLGNVEALVDGMKKAGIWGLG